MAYPGSILDELGPARGRVSDPRTKNRRMLELAISSVVIDMSLVARNRFRRYRLRQGRTLFGERFLQVEWGRIPDCGVAKKGLQTRYR